MWLFKAKNFRVVVLEEGSGSAFLVGAKVIRVVLRCKRGKGTAWTKN